MSSSQPAPGLFPAELSAIPRAEWVSEQFGFAPAGFGTLAIAALCASLFRPDVAERMVRNAATELEWPGVSLGVARLGLLIIGALLLTWEFRRRARRTVLSFRNGVVGIYRNSRFLETIRPGQIRPYLLNRGRTRIMALAALSGCTGVAASLFGDKVDIWLTLLSLAAVIGFSSSAFTRIMLRHYIVVTKNPTRNVLKEFNKNATTEMYEETVMLKKPDIQRIGIPGS